MANIRPIDANAMHKFVEEKVAEGKDGWENGVPYEWAYALTAVDMQPTLDYVPRQQWISVKDRLPEDGVRVLVSANSKSDEPVVAITHYTHRKYGYNIEGWIEPWQYFFYDHEITHWMPLPEPPKEES